MASEIHITKVVVKDDHLEFKIAVVNPKDHAASSFILHKRYNNFKALDNALREDDPFLPQL